MTCGSGLFPRIGCGEEKSSGSGTNWPRSAGLAETGGAECPDAFELLELHSRWFGGLHGAAGTAPGVGNGAVKMAEPEKPSRELGTLIYRIVRDKPDVTDELDAYSQRPAGADAARQETIAETLAFAEQVFQQLPELPQPSRLQASLSALEAALAGTTLSDLEAALAGQETAVQQEAS